MSLQIHFNYVSGATYLGGVVDGMRDGVGTYITPAGMSYRGGWVKNKMEGFGTIKFSNGSTYVGNWLEGKRDGYGTFFLPGEWTYEGGWQNDQWNGHGVLHCSEARGGIRYEGQMKNSKQHGKGTLLRPGKYLYQGDFEENHFHGSAHVQLSCGDRYVGNYASGLRHGEAVYHFQCGDSYAGRWENGSLLGVGAYCSVEPDAVLLGRWFASDDSREAANIQSPYFFEGTYTDSNCKRADLVVKNGCRWSGKIQGKHNPTVGVAVLRDKTLSLSWMDFLKAAYLQETTPSLPLHRLSLKETAPNGENDSFKNKSLLEQHPPL